MFIVLVCGLVLRKVAVMRHTRSRLNTRTASRHITASEMIRDLELRVASLEREAGLIDAVSNTIERVFGDITSTVDLLVRKNKSKIIRALSKNFQARIGGALSGVSYSSVGGSSILGRYNWESVILKKFNPTDPASSVFLDANGESFVLNELFKERSNDNHLYSAYMDWTEEYGPILARALGKDVKMSNDISVMYEDKAISMAKHFGRMGEMVVKELLSLASSPYFLLGMMCVFLIGEANYLFKKILGLFDFSPSMGRVAHEAPRRLAYEAPRREQFVRHRY